MVPPFGMNDKSYSSLSKLLNVLAYMTRFMKKLKKSNVRNGSLTADEIEELEIFGPQSYLY